MLKMIANTAVRRLEVNAKKLVARSYCLRKATQRHKAFWFPNQKSLKEGKCNKGNEELQKIHIRG